MKRICESTLLITLIILICAGTATTAEQAQPSMTAPEPMRTSKVGLLYWPSTPGYKAYDFASSIDKCLTKTMTQKFPEVEIVSQRRLRDGLFPHMEPDTQPKSEEEFAAFLQQSHVHERLVWLGLRYLIAYSGMTQADKGKGFIFCGAGYGGGGCLGFAWTGEKTELQAAVWELGAQHSLGHPSTIAKGYTLMPAVLIPLVIPARTESEACRDLATKIGEFIRNSEARTSGK